MKRYLLLLCLAPLACGGGSGPGDGPGTEGEAEGDGDVTPAVGTVIVDVQPALESGTPFQLIVDGEMMMSAPTGQATSVEVEIGSHDLTVVCPGYGYAVTGYTWDTATWPVSEWTMAAVEVAENATVEVHATVCRDLTGRWDCEGEPCDVYIYTDTASGTCIAAFSPFTVEVRGDEVTALAPGSLCDQLTVPILDGGRRIEFDCTGDGVPDVTFTRTD